MELWYSEFHTGNVKLSVRINRQLLMIPQIRWDIQRDFLQRNSTEAVIRLSEMTESWFISMEVLFMMRMRWNAERCTERFSGHFR